MKKMEFDQAKSYEAAKHFGCFGVRVQGKDETGSSKFWMAVSHFLPNGGAEFDASPTEKLYFVLEGEVTVTDANKQKIVLKKWDSIHIGGNEGRSILNETNKPASMLVVINYPS